MILISKHPNKISELSFNSENHSYFDNNKIVYTSVTSLIGKYFPSFNIDEISTKCAKKRGVSKKSLLVEWEEISSNASDLGHRIHLYSNYLIKDNLSLLDMTIFKNKDKPYLDEINKIYRSIKKELDLIESEKIIFSPELKIAGTYDALFMTKDKKRYVLIDWKTSKNIEIENQWNSFGLEPIQHLSNCNFIHYSLQLRLYSYIMKNEGYINSSLPIIHKIIHIKPNESKSYNIANIDKEILDLTNHYKKVYL